MLQYYDILNYFLFDILKNCEVVVLMYDKWILVLWENYVIYNVYVVNILWEVEIYILVINFDCGSVMEDLEKIRNKWDFQEFMMVLFIGDVRQLNYINIQVVYCLVEVINIVVFVGFDLEFVREVIFGVE